MSYNNHSVRVGADIGGTFTDVVLEIGTDQYSAKVLTNYSEPEQAIAALLHDSLEDAETPAEAQERARQIEERFGAGVLEEAEKRPQKPAC